MTRIKRDLVNLKELFSSLIAHAPHEVAYGEWNDLEISFTGKNDELSVDLTISPLDNGTFSCTFKMMAEVADPTHETECRLSTAQEKMFSDVTHSIVLGSGINGSWDEDGWYLNEEFNYIVSGADRPLFRDPARLIHLIAWASDRVTKKVRTELNYINQSLTAIDQEIESLCMRDAS